MRAREIGREAWRNLASGTSRPLLLACLLGAVCCGLAWVDTRQMVAAVAQAEQYRQRGASITVLEVPQGIDGRACDALGDQPGVRAAGAVRQQPQPLGLAVVPGSPLTFLEASPGFATMLPGSSSTGTGLLLPRDLAMRLGLNESEPIITTAGTTVLAGTYDHPDDGRPPGLGYAAIALVEAGSRFDQCWLDGYPVPARTVDLLYTSIAAGTDQSQLQRYQYNRSLGRLDDPAAAFTARVSAPAPMVGLVTGLLVGAAAVRARRVEIASARQVGVSLPALLAVLLLEALAWSLAAALAALPGIAYLARDLSSADFRVVVWTAAGVPALSVAGALLGAAVAAVTVRQRRLFRYVKA